MRFSEYYSKKIIEVLIKQVKPNENQIFVLLGQAEIVDTSQLIDHIADIETFHLNGNDEIFDRKWFSNIFYKLNSEKHFSYFLMHNLVI